MLDPFQNDNYFNLAELTKVMNFIPNIYGDILKSGLFKVEPITTRTIMIEEAYGTLNLLDTMPLGSPGQENTMGYEKIRTLKVPHIPVNDSISAEHIENIRETGTTNKRRSIAREFMKHMVTIKRKFNITWEYMLINALKGKVLNAKGDTIVDLHKEFEIEKKTFYFDLENPDADILGTCKAMDRYMQDNLLGETYSSIEARVDRGFIDLLHNHPQVLKTFMNHSAANEVRSGLPRKNFKVGDVTFHEYYAVSSTIREGETRRFLDENAGVAYPLGTSGGIFKLYFAPANFRETVHTPGRPTYAKQKNKDWNMGIDYHMQTNPLPVVHRPAFIMNIDAGPDPDA